MNRNKLSTEWSVAMVLGSLRTASAALLGALIVRYWGFNTLLIIAPLVAIPGLITIIINRKYFFRNALSSL